MAVKTKNGKAPKKKKSRREQNIEHAARLAPPEEAATAAPPNPNDNGAIVLNTGSLQLPKSLPDEEQKRHGILNLDPIVIFIVAMMLVFTAFIAFLIYIEPTK